MNYLIPTVTNSLLGHGAQISHGQEEAELVQVSEAVSAELAPVGEVAAVDVDVEKDVEDAPSSAETRRSSSPDDEPLLCALVEPADARPRNTGRFLTMQRRRRRRLTTRTLAADCALLDDVQHGLVQRMLARSGLWPFNAFMFDTVTGGRSLPVMCVHLFHWYGLMDHFKLDVVHVWKLFSLVEEGYHSTNPYHNAIHATDVTQAMHCFLQETEIRRHLTPLEVMSSLIAAVTHDLDHPGVNQHFLIATFNHLAALYENTSVLENHHWRSAVGCLLESSVAGQLESCRKEMEEQISSLILATDITRQAEFIGNFRKYLDEGTLDLRDPQKRHFILQIALKCADISNPCRPWDVSRKWSIKVCEEFFRQGDYERQLNLPVTPVCDRNAMSVAKIQAGFYRFVVAPLFQEWHRFLNTPLSINMMDHLNKNKVKWDSLVAREAGDRVSPEITTPTKDLRLDFDDDELVMAHATAVTGRRHSVPVNWRRNVNLKRGICGSGERRLTLVPVVHVDESTEEDVDPGTATGEAEDLTGGLIGSSSQKTSRSSSAASAGAMASAGLTAERPVSAENLIPEPNIAYMTSSVKASRLSTVLQSDVAGGLVPPRSLTRQQTFPPLQPYVRTRYLSTTAEMSTCSELASVAAIARRGSRSSSSSSSSRTESRRASDDSASIGNGSSVRPRPLRPNNCGEMSAASKAKLARLSLSDPTAAAQLAVAAAALRLMHKENLDPAGNDPATAGSSGATAATGIVGSIRRTSTPQALAIRRGSAPVTLSPRDDLPPVGNSGNGGLNLRPGNERYNRRGSVPFDVTRQSVQRPLTSKENVTGTWSLSPGSTASMSGTSPAPQSSSTLTVPRNLPRRSSLPHDLGTAAVTTPNMAHRHSLHPYGHGGFLPAAPSPAETPVTAPPGFGRKEGEDPSGQRVFWDSMGNILLWPPESASAAPLSAGRTMLSPTPGTPPAPATDPATAAPAPTATTPEVRRSSVPTDISLELLRRLAEEQPTATAISTSRAGTTCSGANGKAVRGSRGKKVLRRRSSGGPELFPAIGPDLLSAAAADPAAMQRWRREVLLVRRLGVTDPSVVLEPLCGRRRGSLPVDVLAATMGQASDH